MGKRGVLASLWLCGVLACGTKPSESHEPSSVEERVHPAAPKAPEPAAQPAAVLGAPAPDFSLSDTDGKVFKLSELRGKVVVLEWFNPDCPFVKAAHGEGPLADMAKRVEDDKHVWLAINSGAPGKQGAGKERNAEARLSFGLTHPVLLDESGAVGRAYGALKTPHMFVIDARGVLVYRGGLDNAPMNVVDDSRPRYADVAAGQRAPYVERALSELAAGKPIALSDTPAYGCSVKYAD